MGEAHVWERGGCRGEAHAEEGCMRGRGVCGRGVHAGEGVHVGRAQGPNAVRASRKLEPQ